MTESAQLSTKLLQKDCQECRITGTLSCAFIGSFILYQSSGGFYAKKPRVQMAVRSLSIAAYYLGIARWFYLPPFTSLQGTMGHIDVGARK